VAAEQLKVFDCAARCGETGTRFISPEGHIRMMAACQPFITGAISKTINLPNDASTEDIARSYWLSWELGLKSNALYRDGCKLSQPLNTKSDLTLEDDEDDLDVAAAREEVANEVVVAAGMVEETQPRVIEKIVEKIIEKPMRKRLPDTRRSITHHFNVAGHEGYLTVGMYDAGGPGELFITMSKEGSTIGGLMDSLGTAISVALQYGVPIESLVTKFAHQRFEPQGVTANRDIPFAKSLVDYIFRWMGMQFISGYREENSPQRQTSEKVTSQRTTTVKEDNRWSDIPDTAPRTSSTITMPTESSITEKTESASQTIVQETLSVEATQFSAGGIATETVALKSSSLSQSTASLQGDAPPCPNCGQITVRNGTCYKCLNCGDSLGCS
jgi:ribonucleoside-diphosphate reductase alpha chain